MSFSYILNCIFCGSGCPTDCYPSHKDTFSCHNPRCQGHAPANPLKERDLLSTIPVKEERNQKLAEIARPTITNNSRYIPLTRSLSLPTVPTFQPPQNLPSISEVQPGLFIGDIFCITDHDLLKTMGITAVVSVISRRPSSNPDHPLNLAIPLRDQLFLKATDCLEQNLAQYFPGACDFINKRLGSSVNVRNDCDDTDDRESDQEKPTLPITTEGNKKKDRVLIHCRKGVSRSVTIAAAYIMFKKRQGVKETLGLIKKARPIADPSVTFRMQLEVWWSTRFQLFAIPEYRVPCEEYENMCQLLQLERLKK